MADRATAARIRRARPADADALARLERRAFGGYYAPHRFSASQFRYYLDRTTTIAHVVVRGEAAVAYVLGVQQTGACRRAARLYSIAVDPDARGRRLGDRLLRAFLVDASRRVCSVSSL
jgi:ribosomal protein S18 acetylase RimI-like enzyme